MLGIVPGPGDLIRDKPMRSLPSEISWWGKSDKINWQTHINHATGDERSTGKDRRRVAC